MKSERGGGKDLVDAEWLLYFKDITLEFLTVRMWAAYFAHALTITKMHIERVTTTCHKANASYLGIVGVV
jgi:hypothetical protein